MPITARHVSMRAAISMERSASPAKRCSSAAVARACRTSVTASPLVVLSICDATAALTS